MWLNRVRRGKNRVRRGKNRVRRGKNRVWHGKNRVRRDKNRVRRGKNSASASCKAGPSSNLGSALQRRPSTDRKTTRSCLDEYIQILYVCLLYE